MTWWSWAWLIFVGAGLALEFAAIRNPARGDTASEHVWALLRKAPVVWFLAAGLLSWTLVHFLGFGIVDGWIGGW